MVELVNVSQIRARAERDAKLTNKVETMRIQKAATAEVQGPLAGLFKRGAGASSAPPSEPEFVYTEYVSAVNSLLMKGADSYFKGGGTLEEELNASRDIKQAVTTLVGGGTTNPIIGGAGAFAAITMKHAALQRLDPKGKAKTTSAQA